MREKLDFIIIATLSSVIFAVVVAMLIGLFDERVDNAEIFKILGPITSMIVGAFVSRLSNRPDKGEPPSS
jgi:hypothetical protein